jgi:Ca2+:H+ antiporter
MGDSFTTSSHNVVATLLPQSTLSLVTEDDDEPPSSGQKPIGTTRVNDANYGRGSTSRPPPTVAVGKNGVYKDVSTEKDHEFTNSDAVYIEDRTFKQEVPHIYISGPDDIEQGRLNVVRQRRHEPSTTMLDVEFNTGRRTRKLRALFTPTRSIGSSPTYLQSLKAALTYTPLNVLLLFIPISWTLHFTHQNPTLIFVFSALGLVPLAALLGFGTEQIALRTSASVGGLLNATLGNIVEMIIAGIALREVSGVLISILARGRLM